MIQERKPKNSSKVNLIVSGVFHALLIAAVFLFAAHEGILGKKLKELTVVMVPKEKKPEPPKEKPPEPKIEPPKAPEPPKVAMAQPKVQTAVAPPPAQESAPAVAPPAAVLSGLDFSDGAKAVQTISDPNGIYKALVEHTLLSRWNRPEDVEEDSFAVEVEVTLDPAGKVKGYRWLNGSGNGRWDDSVKEALAQTKTISRPPPKAFPPVFVVRFDVESMRTEPLQANVQ
jgi:TonB family protein